jgi:hypothetical protein
VAHLAAPARKSKPVPLYYALCKPIANGISINPAKVPLNPAFDIHFHILLTASITYGCDNLRKQWALRQTRSFEVLSSQGIEFIVLFVKN